MDWKMELVNGLAQPYQKPYFTTVDLLLLTQQYPTYNLSSVQLFSMSILRWRYVDTPTKLIKKFRHLNFSEL